jgi:hypothetical protein
MDWMPVNFETFVIKCIEDMPYRSVDATCTALLFTNNFKHWSLPQGNLEQKTSIPSFSKTECDAMSKINIAEMFYK